MTTASQSQPKTARTPLLEELRVMAHDHINWLQSDGKLGRRANLSGRDLSGLSLQGIYLPEANMRGANLSGTNLSDANFQGADFSEALLEQTNFTRAQLDGVNFSRIQARGVYFESASLVGCNFTHSNLQEAIARRGNFSGAKFRDAQLNIADFTGANLQQTIMRHVNAPQAIFDLADLTQADCRDSNFNYARFKQAKIIETNMRGAQFDQVLFTDTDFSQALDLESFYQKRSLESEKFGIKQEIENLRRFKEEVSHYEEHIKNQKRDLMQRRKVLESLNDMEQEVSSSLNRYMKLFRNISMFWFVAVALLSTVLSYKATQLGYENMNMLEIAVIATVFIGVLGAHIWSATLSFNVAKRFARYVRIRREKLAAAAVPPGGLREAPNLEGLDGIEDSVLRAQQSEDNSVTYL